MTEVSWVPDVFAESKIREFGQGYSVEKVPISRIDLEGSRMNCARMSDPLVDSLVEEYSLAMVNGDSFPRPVLLFQDNGSYKILGGNHRTHSAQSIGAEDVEAYVVVCRDAQVEDLLPRCLNRIHGLRQGRDEAIAQAVYATETYGYEPRQAAAMFGVKSQWVTDEIRAKAIAKELTMTGVDSKKIPKTSLLALGGLAGNSNVLTNAARVVIQGHLPCADVSRLVQEVKKKKTEASQIAVVAEYEAATEVPGKPRKASRAIRTRFLMTLSNIEKILDLKTSLLQLQITDDKERENVRNRMLAVADRIKTICDNGSTNGKGRGTGRYQRP